MDALSDFKERAAAEESRLRKAAEKASSAKHEVALARAAVSASKATAKAREAESVAATTAAKEAKAAHAAAAKLAVEAINHVQRQLKTWTSLTLCSSIPAVASPCLLHTLST